MGSGRGDPTVGGREFVDGRSGHVTALCHRRSRGPGKVGGDPGARIRTDRTLFCSEAGSFDREIRTFWAKKYASAGAGVRTGVGELVGGRTRIQTYFGFPTAKKIRVPYSLVDSLSHFSQVRTFSELFSVYRSTDCYSHLLPPPHGPS